MKELFEKLLKLDRVTYEKINDRIGIKTVWWENVCSEEGSPQDIFMGNMILDAVQCEIQRAIAARGWDLRQAIRIIKCNGPNEIHYYAAIEKGFAATYEPFGYEGWGDSPAKAILACYLQAIEAQT